MTGGAMALVIVFVTLATLPSAMAAAPATLPSWSLRDIAPSTGEITRSSPADYAGKPTFLALFQGD